MTDYNKMLIDLLNEKIMRLENEKDRQRKEINRLQRELSKLKKQLANFESFRTPKKENNRIL